MIELISIDEAARCLHISRFTLYYWATARRVPHYKIGRRVMFSKVELQAWLGKHRINVAV